MDEREDSWATTTAHYTYHPGRTQGGLEVSCGDGKGGKWTAFVVHPGHFVEQKGVLFILKAGQQP